MTWSYRSSCCFVLWSSASSVALQNFSNLFTVSYPITVCFDSRNSTVHVVKADTRMVFLYCSESAIGKVQTPPARTARRSQSKVKPRPPESEMDLQLLQTLCKENDCNSEEVGRPAPRFQYIHYSQMSCLYIVYIVSFPPFLWLQVKNVYQTSFSAFLDPLDLSGVPHFPQVGRSITSTPALLLVLFSTYISMTYFTLLPVAIVQQVCDSCWLLPCIACLFVVPYMMSEKCVLKTRIALARQ